MIQPTIPIVVYQRKEKTMENINTMVQNVSVQEVTIETQEVTQDQIGQEDTSIPTTKTQGVIEIENKRKE